MEINNENTKKTYTPVIKAGFLSKKSNERSNWHKRWFELRSSSLVYFNTRKGNKQKGEISINNSTTVIIEDEKNNIDRSHIFTLKTNQQTYQLAAFNEVDLKAWFKSISKLVNKPQHENAENGETFSPPSSPRTISSSSKSSKSQKSKKSLIRSEAKSPKQRSSSEPTAADNLSPRSLPSSSLSSNVIHSGNINANNNNVDIPKDLTSCNRDQLVDIVYQLFSEHQKTENDFVVLKQKSGDLISALKSQLLLLYSQNKQIKKELMLKDANIKKMQLKIIEANQMVVEAIPFQETVGRTRAHTLMKMLTETGIEPANPID